MEKKVVQLAAELEAAKPRERRNDKRFYCLQAQLAAILLLFFQSRESSPDAPPPRYLFALAEDEGSSDSGGDELQNTL